MTKKTKKVHLDHYHNHLHGHRFQAVIATINQEKNVNNLHHVHRDHHRHIPLLLQVQDHDYVII